MVSDERGAYVERVLRVVEAIPPGRVMAYGAIADVVRSGGPRQVGRVMSRYGSGVPWWRVVRADGTLPPSHGLRARAVLPGGDPFAGEGVDMVRAAWHPPELPFEPDEM